MTIGIISDIHGNKEALDVVLNELQNTEQIFCLGDIVGYGADPIYCIEKMKEMGCVCIKGNHEGAIAGELDLFYFNDEARQSLKWTNKQLNCQNYNYLTALPGKINITKHMLGVHGSPRQPLWEYILDQQTAEEIFNKFGFKACFVGHSHIAGYFTFHREDKVIRYFDAIAGAEFFLDDKHSYIINCGSVGQPRDGNPQTCFVTFNSEEGVISIKRIGYPIIKAQNKINEACLPAFLAERLAIGI